LGFTGGKMNKILFFVLSFSLSLIIYANPLSFTQAVISELKFNEDNSWILEIGFLYGFSYEPDKYDSICIRNHSGSSIINLINLEPGIYVFVLTNDSLSSPLVIDRNGDYISIVTYGKDFEEYPFVDSLTFGSYTGSVFPGLLPVDYSFCRLNFYRKDWGYYHILCRDKSPTIGFPNDSAGTTGILTGYIYDRDNKLVTSGIFSSDYEINFDSTGVYTTKVLSRNLNLNGIYKEYSNPMFWLFLRAENISCDIYPDSVLHKDIYLQDYIVNVKENGIPEEHEPEIINYPNPFNSTTNFYIDIPSGFNYEEGEINIFNVNGERVFSIKINRNSQAVWKGNNFNGESAASGIYYYQLSLDSRIYKNGSMILLK
jgi:hypothetical protein